MTAATVYIPSPVQIAFSCEFTSGTWTDPATGRGLIEYLAHHLGPAAARLHLDAAADLVDTHHSTTRSPR